MAAYVVHAARYYVDADGKPTKELDNMKTAIKPVRELYQRLFVARETISTASHDWELVLGVGRLKWSPADRHVLVQPIRIDLDAATGSLIVLRDDIFVSEQDMLSPDQLPAAEAVAALDADLDVNLTHGRDGDAVEDLAVAAEIGAGQAARLLEHQLRGDAILHVSADDDVAFAVGLEVNVVRP